MCPRSNDKETSLKFTSLPIHLALNLNNEQIESINTSDLHINDHIIVDHYIDTLQNSERIINHRNSTIDLSAKNQNSKNIFGIEMPLDIFSAAFTSAVIGGGVFGYLKAGSKPSLIAGLAFGTLLGVGTYMTSVNPDNFYLTLGTSTVLAGVMGKRFASSGKLMPAGLIAGLSLSMVVRCLYQMTVKDSANK